MELTLCRHCGAAPARPGGWFCSDAHRKRAQRRREAGLPEHLYPSGARRGRVPLGEETMQETAWRLVRLGLPGSSGEERSRIVATEPNLSDAVEFDALSTVEPLD